MFELINYQQIHIRIDFQNDGWSSELDENLLLQLCKIDENLLIRVVQMFVQPDLPAVESKLINDYV